MRGLVKASVLLVPALARAFVLPTVVADVEDHNTVYDHSLAFIGVEITSTSNDWVEAFPFRLEVFPSEQACGYANVTIDGQVLPQTLNGEGSHDVGSITTDRKDVVIGSWSFQCIKVNGQPDSQLMRFTVDVVDGKPTLANGFTALFRQTGLTEIIRIGTDLSLLDEVLANPNPERLQPVDQENHEFSQFRLEQEMDELHWLRAQMRELEFLIRIQEQAIAEHTSAHFEEDIQECDSLKCVAVALIDKARKAAHHVVNKIHGHPGEHEHCEEEEFEHPPKSKHGKEGNHICGPPKHHGNHSAPPGPPYWKRPPHRRPLPICRYPPPLHGKKPKHPPPPPWKRPPPPPNRDPQHPPGPPEDGHSPHPPPGQHGGRLYDSPDGSRHSRPDHDDPAHEGLPYHENGPFDGPRAHGPHEGSNNRPHDEPHGPQGDFEAESPFIFDLGAPDSLPFDGPGPHPHNSFGRAFHITKYVTIGILISLLVIAFHRRACTPRNRADRRGRREERHRRRAFRRSARKHAIIRFLACLSGHESEDAGDDEEKRQDHLASAKDGRSTTMTEEIIEFRNAAEVVDDMVAESSRRPQVQPISVPIAASTIESVPEDRPLMREYNFGSQVGDGEELPAYDDNDGSEMSSVVADGFRYTPGSTEYSPAHSLAGSVSDILGPDTKT